MTRVTPKTAQAYVANLEKKLDALADGRTSVKASELKNDPMLMDLAKDVFTGCGAMKDVSVKKMRDALKTIASTMATIDKDKDGRVDYSEAARLSPLALRMLDMAAEKGADPVPTPAPSRPVSSGCGGGGAVAPAPSRPTRTGC